MKYFSLALLTFVVYSCNTSQQQDNKGVSSGAQKDSLRTLLMNVDRSWSERSRQKGYHASRLDFASDSAIDLLDGEMPLHGIKEIKQYAATHPDSSYTLEWKPLRCAVATSGDIGYTYGGWTMHTKTKQQSDTSLYGDYITVWKKQTDGSWKYVVDGGTNTPKRVEY